VVGRCSVSVSGERGGVSRTGWLKNNATVLVRGARADVRVVSS